MMIEKAVSTSGYAAGGATFVIGTMSAGDVAALVGAAVALGTFLLNLWYKRQLVKIAAGKAQAAE